MLYHRNFMLLLCLVFSACAPATKPAPVTLTPLREKTPTATLSATQQPSKTPVATETYEPYPTSTYRAPTPIASTHYRLKHWTPELANAWIETLRKYPDSLGYSDRGYHDGGYYYAYIYAASAEQEAQLLFPSSTYKTEWAWDASYNLAQSDGEAALESYRNLLQAGLDTGAASLSRLESWFAKHETRLKLKATKLLGTPENYLLEIADDSESYGGFLWAAKQQGKFSVYPLHGNHKDYDGDFYPPSADGVSAQVMDLTGDGVAEIITVHIHAHGVGSDFTTTGLDVFDVSHATPERLRFVPDVSYTRGDDWSLLEENHQGVGLTFNFFDSNCPLTVPQQYRWKRKNFERVATLYPDKQQLLDKGCFNWFVAALPTDFDPYQPDALKKWDELIADWPNPKESLSAEYENLPDARDRLRFKAALYLAFEGDETNARREMTALVQSPVVPNDNWVALAEIFLLKFHDRNNDLPETCLAIKLCLKFFRTETLINLAAKSHQNPINFLRQIGVVVGQSGSVDVNNDGEMDQWANITENHHTLPWLFVATKDGWQPLFVFYFAEDGIQSLKSKPAFQDSPLFVVDGADGSAVYQIKTNPETLKLEAVDWCRSISSDIATLEADLLNKRAPAATIEKQLLVILPELGRNCPDQDYPNAFARYLLGVTYQFAGDSARAAENYYTVWQSFPQTPFALMAQAKLETTP